jgi:diguanylate cyclase (GGDEF)-like protein/PAS domain S-box-containing protein
MSTRTNADEVVTPTVPRSAYPRDFTSTYHAVAVVSLDFRIVDANSAFVHTVGLPFDEIYLAPLGTLWDFDAQGRPAELEEGFASMRVVTLAAGPAAGRPGVQPATLTIRTVDDVSGTRVGYAVGATNEATKREQRRISLDSAGLQLSFDQIAVGMLLTGMDGYAIKCNPAMRTLLGRTFEEIATTELLAMVWPDDRQQVIEEASRLIVGEIDSYSKEMRLLDRDGSPVWVHEIATCVRDDEGNPVHFMSQFVDIRDRKAAEAELHESQATIRFLFDDAPAPLVQLDETLRIRTANAAVAQLLGRDPIGVSLRDVVHPDDLARFGRDGAAIQPDTDWVVDMRIRRADGTDRVVRCQGRIHRFDDGRFRSATASWHDITDAKEQEDRLLVRASTDPLTGLPHRTTFFERLDEAIRAATRADSVAVLFIDLDRFKPVNDTYGHETGDDVLCQVGRRLRTCVRGTDMVARIGGDEFVVLLDLEDPGIDPTRIGERIVEHLGHPITGRYGSLEIGASVGLAYAGPGSEPRDVVHRADLAAYQAKSSGGSRLVVASG